jgi:hypothetical protein
MDDTLRNILSVATLTRETQAHTDQQLIALWLHGRPASLPEEARTAYPTERWQALAYLTNAGSPVSTASVL